MPPRRALFVFVGLAALLLVQDRVGLGGSVVTAVLCAFALMIGGPIAILAWFGSLTDRDAKRRMRRRDLEVERSQALLWQRTLVELQPVWLIQGAAVAVHADAVSKRTHLTSSARVASDFVAAAFAKWVSKGRRAARPILGLYIAILSTIGLGACGVPPEAWAMVRPGMGTAELVAIAGGPDYVRSNGTNEVWQYCRDFYGRDEGHNARYYTAVLVNNQTIQDVRPYPVLSNAGCYDFYRANF